MIAAQTEGAAEHVLPGFYRALRAVDVLQADSEADTGTYSYRYVSLGRVIETVNAALAEQNLAVTQTAHVADGRLLVSTTLLAETGDWVRFEALSFELNRNAQAIGSAITYGRRYALTALFALVVEDDDGGAASQSQPGRAERQAFRTASERMIHELFAGSPAEWGVEVRSRFRFHFNVGLSQLPPDRHDEALVFVREQLDAIELAGGLP